MPQRTTTPKIEKYLETMDPATAKYFETDLKFEERLRNHT
jgi:hypothetical protein